MKLPNTIIPIIAVLLALTNAGLPEKEKGPISRILASAGPATVLLQPQLDLLLVLSLPVVLLILLLFIKQMLLFVL
jgi:hypothetical protein